MLRLRASRCLIIASLAAWAFVLAAGCDKAPSEVAERPPGGTAETDSPELPKVLSRPRKRDSASDFSSEELPPHPAEQIRTQDEWMDLEAEMLSAPSAVPRHLSSTPGLSLDADDPQSHAPLQRPPSHIGDEFLDADAPVSQLSDDDVTPRHLGVDRDVDDPRQRVYDDPAPSHISSGAPSLPPP